jgi:hypothetical protein
MTPTRPPQQKPAKFGELSHAIEEFLEWAEQKKGLLLCSAYKPKYAWYTPAGASCQDLLTEFLAIESKPSEPAAPAQDQITNSRTATPVGYGWPSRRAMLVPGK